MLTKVGLIRTYHNVLSVGLSGNVHFKLDNTVASVQCTPRNISTALMAPVKVSIRRMDT